MVLALSSSVCGARGRRSRALAPGSSAYDTQIALCLERACGRMGPRLATAMARLGYLECAMLGALARSFSQWGSVVLRPCGRPSVHSPPRGGGLWAGHSTCEVLTLVAGWLGVAAAVQISNFRKLDTAVDATLLAGTRFWWTVAWKRRQCGHRYNVLCWHTSWALAELAYAIAELGPAGWEAAATDMRLTADELADWVAAWLDQRERKAQLGYRLLHNRQLRHDELMERAHGAARVFERIDSALCQRIVHWGTPRMCEVRPWRHALSNVVSWTRTCGPPAAEVVSAVLGLGPEETLRRLQSRLRDASGLGGARSEVWSDIWTETTAPMQSS